MTRRANDPDLLAALCAGFVGLENKNLWSSNLWEAHEIGKEWAKRGKWQPQHIAKSRGSSYFVNYALCSVQYRNGQPIEISIAG